MSTPVSQRQHRINWLLAHQELWEGWPRPDSSRNADKLNIVRQMQDAGLYKPTTHWLNVGLDTLIAAARRQRRIAAATEADPNYRRNHKQRFAV